MKEIKLVVPNLAFPVIWEDCIFCMKETALFHKKTNLPVCKDCAKIHSEKELNAFLNQPEDRY